jgi:membrane associated rhomboid family serine protease
MFFHFGALHIILNMLALWDFGRALEQRVGSTRLVITFVLTGVVGFIVSDYWYALRLAGQLAPTAGASGGLFGLVGSLIGYLFARRDPAWKTFLLHVTVFTVVVAILPLPINNAAHIGGFVTGAPLGYAFFKEHRPWRHTPVLIPIAALFVLASVASIVLSQRSPEWRLEHQREIERETVLDARALETRAGALFALSAGRSGTLSCQGLKPRIELSYCRDSHARGQPARTGARFQDRVLRPGPGRKDDELAVRPCDVEARAPRENGELGDTGRSHALLRFSPDSAAADPRTRRSAAALHGAGPGLLQRHA